MSNLTDLLPAGAGGKQVDFVASGAIGNGVTVALKTDGTVEVVSSSSFSAGSPIVFEAASSDYNVVTFDSSNNKIVINYRDGGNSNYGTAIVGTVSGTSISFGTPVVFVSGSASWAAATFDSNSNKIVIAWASGVIVGTVSGTSISFGSATTYGSNNASYNAITFDSSNNKVVIAYSNQAISRYGYAVVGTVSGTSISFGTQVVFESAETNYVGCTFDSNSNKVIIGYQDNPNSSAGTAIVGTVSGTSISFGSPVVFRTGTTDFINLAFDTTNNKVVVAYSHSSNGKGIVGTVSGTSISFGTEAVFIATQSWWNSIVYDSNTKKVIIACENKDTSYGTAIEGTVSGTSITFNTPLVFEAANSDYVNIAFDSLNNKLVVAYMDVGNGFYGTSAVLTAGSSNITDFIGITDAAISDTATGSVTIKGGISNNVTGLTPNTDYYVQSDGTLSTTTSTVLAGKALSATSINLDYTT
jgi:hypothetical protein